MCKPNRSLFIFLIIVMIGCSSDEQNQSKTPEEQTIDTCVDGIKNGTETGVDCGGDCNDCLDEEESTENPNNLIEITTTLDLPIGSVMSAEDLLTSSFLTSEAPFINNESKIEVIDNNEYEMVFVEDESNEIVLMAYFTPNEEELTVDAKTTAMAMLMIQSWTVDLLPSAKNNLMEQITTLAEFGSLVEDIESSLKTDGIPLQNDEVMKSLNLLTEKVLGNNTMSKGKNEKSYFDEIEPLYMSATDNTISIKNSSSMEYGVKINDGEIFPLEGVQKQILITVVGTLYDRYYNTESFSPTELRLIETNEGYKDIYTGNGNIDKSEQQTNVGDNARFNNLGRIGFSIISTSSSLLGTFTDNPNSCSRALGEYIFQRLGDSFYSIEDPSTVIRTILNDVIEPNTEEVLSIIGDCYDSKANSFIGRVLKVYGAIMAGISAIDTSLLIYDWVNHYPEINFCTEKVNEGFTECLPLQVSSQFNLGNIPINRAVFNTISLENKSNDIITVNSVNILDYVNEGIIGDFSTNFNGPITIAPKQTHDLLFSMESIPSESTVGAELRIDYNYKEDLKLVKNYFGSVIKPLFVTYLDGTPASNIDFGEVIVNQVSSPIELLLNNHSDYSVILYSSGTSVSGFNYSWDEQTIDSLGQTIIEFQFAPENTGYNGAELIIENGSLQPLRLNLTGQGVNENEGDEDLLSDASAIREIYAKNPQVTQIYYYKFGVEETFNVNLNDPRWTSNNMNEVIDILEEYGCTIENNRVVEFGWVRVGVGSSFSYTLNEKINNIPSDIGNLSKLRGLYLGGYPDNSAFSLLPPELGDLQDLEILFLKSNQALQTLPSEIGNLFNLRELYLEYCTSLTSIPPEVGNLSSLNYFTLCRSSNLLCMPPEVWNLITNNNLDLNHIDLDLNDTDCTN